MRRRTESGSQYAKPVKDLFAVYKKRLQAPQKSVIKEVVIVIKEEFGITVQDTEFRYNVQTKTIYCLASGMVRNELKLHTPLIYSRLKERLGEQNTPKLII